MAEHTNESDEIPPLPGRPVLPEFLGELPLRKIALPPGCPFTILGLAIGQGATPLEVLAVESAVEPNLPQVRAVWKARQGGRAAPLTLAVLHDGKATLCGPSGDEPATYSGDLSRELSVHGLEGDIRPAVTSTATTTSCPTPPGASTSTKRTETIL